MFELYCFMCGHIWNDAKQDSCPNCKCKDFIINDIGDEFDKDGHYEGDFHGGGYGGKDYGD